MHEPASTDIRTDPNLRTARKPASNFLVPDGFAIAKINPREGKPFNIIHSADPSAYEGPLLTGQDWGTFDVVWLLRQFLRV